MQKGATMSGFQPANESSPRKSEFRPLLDPSADPPSDREESGGAKEGRKWKNCFSVGS